MPSIVNQIGPFLFLSMQGNPPGYADRIEVIRRIGVDGIKRRRLGLATPFRVRTSVDVLNIGFGRIVFEQYSALKFQPSLAFTYRGYLYLNQNLGVQVNDVTQVELQRVVAISGGFSSLSRALLRVDWDLELVTL